MKTCEGVDLGTRWRFCGQLHTPAASALVKQRLVPIGYEAGWAPEPVWTLWRREKSYLCRDTNPDRPARTSQV
jgi:hypothetical protein